ncbi:MarR family transcriptional regulator [Candidatus Falkowbacteria bacterium]|jgi:DNA-binding MarR family transcriptional regulator|nr:MarR family transcriptional regulator [Candidatus Falkowbacteria bacterium]MBT5502977.1 MarR family transcriptional regulator [Candidatus Falkowbacteria bacterium]MBT6574333.1 MarR family transcriptional regulator [Candidatus Falkowbacteria bacterium]MBT7349074.1 MarR family transcriptional regulator [Candidatus Falkowbacteria bacterium]MBT7500932.1 MarR family transcriptional regulator [Candidatus Falkowbacteria bacterium]
MPKTLNSQLVSMLFATKRALMNSMCKEKNFSPVDYIQAETLSFILKNPKTLSKDVAEFLAITSPSATTLIDKLEKQGLVKRTHSKSDRRKINLQVTPDGETFIKQTVIKMKKIAQEMFKVLDEQDKKNLVNIYQKILNNYK